MASAGARACNGGSGDRAPSWGPGGRAPVGGQGSEAPPKLVAFLYCMGTHFCAVLELVVVADLTEATREFGLVSFE